MGIISINTASIPAPGNERSGAGLHAATILTTASDRTTADRDNATASDRTTAGRDDMTIAPFTASDPDVELVLIVSVPGLSFQELAPDQLQVMPTLERLAGTGRLAALNIRTPERGIEDVYMSINAGAPAIAPGEVQAYRVPEHPDSTTERSSVSGALSLSAALTRDEGRDEIDSYTRYMGKLPGAHTVVVPQAHYLTSLNKSQTYDSHIGRLGNTLQAANVRLAVFSNGQPGDQALGYAPLMLMSADGTVAYGGSPDRFTIDDPASPGGIRTDGNRLVDELHHALTDPAFPSISAPAVLFVEYSDWHRLDQERRNYDADRWTAVRMQELIQLDRLLQQLLALIDTYERAQLWVWSPQPHAAATKQKLHVTPFILYDSFMSEARMALSSGWSGRNVGSGSEPGLLTSPTTKRPGLISLHDLAPTLLSALGIDDSTAWTGFPVETEARSDALAFLLDDVKQMQHVYELRTMVVVPFVAYEVVVLLLGLILVLLKRRNALQWMRIPLFSLLIAPLIILLLGAIPGWAPLTQLTVLIVTVAALSFACACFASRTSILIIAAANTLVLQLDGWLGANLIKSSIMGYDPMIGARYYGIGNEYMGVLVGSAILAAMLAVQQMRDRSPGRKAMGSDERNLTPERPNRALLPTDAGTQRPARLIQHSANILDSRKARQRRIRITRRLGSIVIAFWFIVVVIFLAAPQGGTNAGGALTASAAFGIAWLRMFGSDPIRRVNIWRLVLITGSLLTAGLIVLWALNQWLVSDGVMGKSHIGRAMDLLAAGRFDVIAGMIVRKLQMNLTLFGVSSWGKVLMTGIFVLTVLFFKPRGILNEWQQTRPIWMSGFAAIIIGSIVALALNDSGIVAAGTMIVFAAAPILLLIADHALPPRRTSRSEASVSSGVGDAI